MQTFRGVLRDANMVEVLIQCMEWNMVTSQSHILESELPELQQKAVDLLDMVSEIVLWGDLDNTSCQAPKVYTWYTHVHTWYILICSYLVVVHTSSYLVHTECILSMYVLSARPYREYQDGGKPYQQQGCLHVHPVFPCLTSPVRLGFVILPWSPCSTIDPCCGVLW